MARPRKDPTDKKTVHLSTRFRADLRAKLQAAADKRGVKLSEEVAARLEASFDHEQRITEEFGGPVTRAFCVLLAQALKSLCEETGRAWHTNRFTFEQARIAADEAFHYFQPSGPNKAPADLPAIEKLRAQGIPVKREVLVQARKYPFGLVAARLAVFNMESMTKDSNWPAETRDIFVRLAKALAHKLSATGAAQRDLIKWRKK